MEYKIQTIRDGQKVVRKTKARRKKRHKTQRKLKMDENSRNVTLITININEKKDKLKGRDNSIGFFKFQLFLFLKDLKCENMKRKVKRK